MKRFRSGAGLTAAVLLGMTFILIVLVPLLPSYEPYQQNLADGLLAIGDRTSDGVFSPLGTDTLGRDLLSRLSLAGRVSFLIAIAAVAISLVIGAALGLIAGFFGGWTESLIMGIADLQLSIPRILLLIAVTAVVGAAPPYHMPAIDRLADRRPHADRPDDPGARRLSGAGSGSAPWRRRAGCGSAAART